MNEALVQEIKQRLEYEEQRTAPPEGFPALPDIPAARYTDDGFYQLEQESIWSKTWLFAGHADEVLEVGDYKLWNDSGVPIIILRDEDNRVRAFYNTCRHRGAPVVNSERGNSPRLQCTYHGWTYNLDGKLIGVPDQRDFIGLDTSCRGLIEVRCETWGKWVFCNLDNDADSLLDYLGAVVDDFAQFDPDSIRFYEKHHIDIAANWKACVDAFMEVYHLQFLHPETVHDLLHHRAAVMGLMKNGHSRMFTQLRHGRQQSDPKVPEIASVGEIPRLTNMAYSLFPNFIVPLDMTGFPFLVFWPQSIRRTRMDVWWFGPDDASTQVADRVWEDKARLDEQWQQRLQVFDVVLGEDTQWLPSVQNSMETPAFTGVPLNYQERRLYHFHEAIDGCIGREGIPTELRVEPKLAEFIEA